MEKRPAGSVGFMFFEGAMLLILRDDRPDIPSPNVWAPPGGGVEGGETYHECMRRESQEEIGIVPGNLEILGVSAKGNGYFFSVLTQDERSRVKLGDEGQRLGFFLWCELETIEIGGALEIYRRKYPEAMQAMFSLAKVPSHFGARLGLSIWNGYGPA